MNTDELLARMERDELSDASWLTPRDLAKLLGVTPQLVYYYIRNKKLSWRMCECGHSKIVPVKEAIELFERKKVG